MTPIKKNQSLEDYQEKNKEKDMRVPRTLLKFIKVKRSAKAGGVENQPNRKPKSAAKSPTKVSEIENLSASKSKAAVDKEIGVPYLQQIIGQITEN